MPVQERYRGRATPRFNCQNPTARIYKWVSMAVLTLVSCRVLSAAPQQAVAPEPVSSASAPAVATATAPRLPAVTLVPTPTSSGPACVPADPGVGLPESAYENYPEVILAFLNAGGTLERLGAGLYDAGVASLPVTASAADMTGDGKQEVAVSIFEPGSEAFVPPGTLLLYRCQEARFELALAERSEVPNGPPHLWYLQDLNADGAAELVVSEPVCGAHTCFEDVRVLAWNGSGFENVLEGSTADLANPDVRITDDDGDGVYDLELAGGGISSVGAGPPREARRIWADTGDGRWALEGEVFGEPVYRIHALHDAEAAARVGDFENALVLYARVIEDDNLEDWLDPEVERANLAAYAGYKTVVLFTLQEQSGFAELALAGLREAHPPDGLGAPYVKMASVFLEGHEQGGVAQGCADAIAFAAANVETVLAPLGEGVFGYGNPSVAAADMCP